MSQLKNKKWISMNVYLIAPLPSFNSQDAISDYRLSLDEPFALVAAAGITTVAAFFDDSFNLKLCDEITEQIDFENPADVICISMNVSQAARGIEIARRFRATGRTIIMGGPHVSLEPELFNREADCIVVGEFESIAATVISDLRNGSLQPRYDGEKSDLSQSPIPRWDLYNNDRAISGVVQTSRGCPFECNFCDVIQYLGRTQRHKPIESVIKELQQLYDLGYRSVSLADDNFTAYRKRARQLLQALIDWNGRNGREPTLLGTQMSIDIARDDNLLEMCNEAGLRNAFIGIETTNEEALKTSLKRQNLRPDLTTQCIRIVAAGITVQTGIMVGFDSDTLSCFEQQFEFVMSLPVINAKVSVLVAPVTTPLHTQLKAQGRVLEGLIQDAATVGNYWTNIEPKNMTRQQLAEGATWLANSLNTPDNVIRRFESYAAILKPAPEHLRQQSKRSRRTAGTDPMLQILQKGMKDPGGRRIVEAVDAMTKARPEIRHDLISSLVMHLNLWLNLKKHQHKRSQNPSEQIIALLA